MQGSIKTRQRIALAANYWALQVLAQLLWKDRPTPYDLRERACPRTGDTVKGEREHGTRHILTHAVRLAPWKAIPMQTDQKPHLTLPQPQRSSTSRDPEDEVLIRQIAAHDAEAFTTLYQRYAPRLAGFLYPRLAEPDLVDDVLHETLLVVWQGAARFRGQAQLSTWIFCIAQRKAHQARVAALSTYLG